MMDRDLSNLTLQGYKDYLKEALYNAYTSAPKEELDDYFNKSIGDIEYAYRNEYLPCKLPKKTPDTGGFESTFIMSF